METCTNNTNLTCQVYSKLGISFLKTKTLIYLSIIISAYIVGKLFNPIPMANYAFYIIVTALFVPYFGKLGALKILVGLSSISLLMDIPFLIAVASQWTDMVQGMIIGVNDLIPAPTQHAFILTHHPYAIPLLDSMTASKPAINEAQVENLFNIMANPIFVVVTSVGSFYLGITVALIELSSAFKRAGIYKRIQL